MRYPRFRICVFFFNDTATTEIYTLSLHDALPIFGDERIRNLSPAWHHMIGNVLAVLLSLWNWWRRYAAADAGAAVVPAGLIISLIVVLMLLYTRWRGWEMVSRPRVGGSDEPGLSARATGASSRLRPLFARKGVI